MLAIFLLARRQGVVPYILWVISEACMSNDADCTCSGTGRCLCGNEWRQFLEDLYKQIRVDCLRNHPANTQPTTRLGAANDAKTTPKLQPTDLPALMRDTKWCVPADCQAFAATPFGVVTGCRRGGQNHRQRRRGRPNRRHQNCKSCLNKDLRATPNGAASPSMTLRDTNWCLMAI